MRIQDQDTSSPSRARSGRRVSISQLGGRSRPSRRTSETVILDRIRFWSSSGTSEHRPVTGRLCAMNKACSIHSTAIATQRQVRQLRRRRYSDKTSYPSAMQERLRPSATDPAKSAIQVRTLIAVPSPSDSSDSDPFGHTPTRDPVHRRHNAARGGSDRNPKNHRLIADTLSGSQKHFGTRIRSDNGYAAGFEQDVAIPPSNSGQLRWITCHQHICHFEDCGIPTFPGMR